MKFTACNEVLLDSLLDVVNVASRPLIKDHVGANMILLKTSKKKDTLYAAANNGYIAIKASISNKESTGLALDISDDGQVLVNASDLVNVLKSFAPDLDMCVEAASDNELKISPVDDDSQYQSLPTYSSSLGFPSKAKEFEKELTIRRDLFLYGLKRISFAIGFEQERPEYLYWVLRTVSSKQDKIRFVAGSGARFACLDMEGDDLIETNKKKMNLLFSKHHTAVLSKILGRVEDENLIIKESDPKDDNAPYQVNMKIKNIHLIMTGISPNVQWPDENKIINQDSNYKFTVKTDEWELASRGIFVTFNDEVQAEKKPHIGEMSIDLDDNTIFIESDETMKAKRKVSILDSSIASTDDTDDDLESMVSFNCASLFLHELANHANKSQHIQMELVNSNRPMVVRYYSGGKVDDKDSLKETNKALNLDEKFTIFFAPSSL